MKSTLRKILVLSLALFMTMGVHSFAQAAGSLEISSGDTMIIDVTDAEITYIKFVPQESGVYSFYSLSDEDTVGYLYDEDMNELAYSDDYMDDYGEDFNFRITYSLEAEKVYYWGVGLWDEELSGSFEVVLLCDEVSCSHENTIVHQGVDASCANVGYTAGTYCNDCEEWIEGHEIIPESHTDMNTDRICDNCGGVALLASGNWEGGTNWKLYFDGCLEITGTGAVGAVPSDYDSQVKEVIMPYGITRIDAFAFGWCDKLKTIEIPDSVTYVGDYAFAGCESLENIKLSSGINEIAPSVFLDCVSLKSIEIPEGIEEISTGAFSGCSGLERISFPSTLTYIYSYVFADENDLEVYYNGTRTQWEEISINRTNIDLTNATIHFKDEPHTHNYASTVTTPATCTTEGVMTYTCSCSDSYTETISATGHTDSNSDGVCDSCNTQLEEKKEEKISFFAIVKAFFQRIIDWFKNLFR